MFKIKTPDLGKIHTAYHTHVLYNELLLRNFIKYNVNNNELMCG